MIIEVGARRSKHLGAVVRYPAGTPTAASAGRPRACRRTAPDDVDGGSSAAPTTDFAERAAPRRRFTPLAAGSRLRSGRYAGARAPVGALLERRCRIPQAAIASCRSSTTAAPVISRYRRSRVGPGSPASRRRVSRIMMPRRASSGGRYRRRRAWPRHDEAGPRRVSSALPGRTGASNYLMLHITCRAASAAAPVGARRIAGAAHRQGVPPADRDRHEFDAARCPAGERRTIARRQLGTTERAPKPRHVSTSPQSDGRHDAGHAAGRHGATIVPGGGPACRAAVEGDAAAGEQVAALVADISGVK